MLPTLPTAPPHYPVLSDTKFLQLAGAYHSNSFMPDRIKVELETNGETALESLAAHQKYIDQLAAAGKQILVQAKAAVTKADKGKTADKEAALKTSFNAERELLKIAQLAHDDHQAFDGAWNKFRALNVGANAPDLPAEYAADFIRAREKIMADGKLINVKVDKLAQFAVQAKALTKLSAARVGTAGQQTPERKLAEAQTAAAELEQHCKDLVFKAMGNERLKPGSGGKNIGWYSLSKKLSTLTANANLTTVREQDYATSQQVYVNIQAATKTYKATVKTMDTLMAVAERAIPSSLSRSDGVAGPLAAAKTIRDEAAQVNKEAIALLAAAEKLVTKTKQKVGKK